MFNTPEYCQACAARQFGICRALNSSEIARLKQIARRRSVATGEVISREGDAQFHLATVVSGVVKLGKRLVDGRQQLVGFLFPSDFLGRPLAATSPFTATAASDVVLCTYRQAQFENLIRELPKIEHCLFSHVLNGLDAAQEWMVLLGQKTASEKVASLLLLFARRGERLNGTSLDGSPAIRFEFPLSRADMADCLGLRIETVSRQIGLLKAQGIIQLEGTRIVTVPRIEKLLASAETERA